MKFGSVCSGIESASVAWSPLGWSAEWFAEVDPFACAVLAHRYPTVPNLGDFTRIGKGVEVGTVDVLVGGTPCQSFSVAGRRAGLDDPRGILTLEFLTLVGRLRPRWLVWENVPGVLSEDDGRSLGTVLWIVGELGYRWAWRVLDAQYFGVAQRRRRLFLVGHLGTADARSWSVLFERESFRGDPPPRRESREDAPASPGARASGDDRGGDVLGEFLLTEVAGCLQERDAKGTDSDTKPGHLIVTPDLRVRRLMPVEFERLQGFPDDYTLVPYRGRVAADAARYRVLGNAMAVPVMNWIGRRIALAEELFGERGLMLLEYGDLKPIEEVSTTMTTTTTRGQLPKAYLRLDPNADQHPDAEGLLLLICAANRQRPRGRFQPETARKILGGQARLARWMKPRPGKRHPDLIARPDGTLYLDGWDEWQEGDLTVGERVARLRARTARAVSPPLPKRFRSVSPPLQNRKSPPRRKALGVRRKEPNGNGRETTAAGGRGRRRSKEKRAARATPLAAAVGAWVDYDPGSEQESLLVARVEGLAVLVASADNRTPTDDDRRDVLAAVTATPRGKSLEVVRGASRSWIAASLRACDDFERDQAKEVE